MNKKYVAIVYTLLSTTGIDCEKLSKPYSWS